jgi:8-oxo-dGTP diphosphatase
MKKAIDYIGVSAGALIVNEKGELFLTKRSQRCKNQRGCWESPGGDVEYGETLVDAVRREVMEEYGVEIELIEQFPAADELLTKEKQHWVATTFLAKLKKGQTPTIMEPDKCDEIGWFPLDNLPSPLSVITKLDLKTYEARFQTEMIDIVNEQDELLYQASKRRAHDLGLLHRTVIGSILTTKGHILLVKQAADRQDAGQYVHPVGGHVRVGETESEALNREAYEEAGLKDFASTFLKRAIYNREVLGRRENHYFIMYQIVTDEPLTLNHEAVSYQEFTKARLKKEIKTHPELFGDAFYFVMKECYPEFVT